MDFVEVDMPVLYKIWPPRSSNNWTGKSAHTFPKVTWSKCIPNNHYTFRQVKSRTRLHWFYFLPCLVSQFVCLAKHCNWVSQFSSSIFFGASVSLWFVLPVHLFVYLRSWLRHDSYLSSSFRFWCNSDLHSEIPTMEDARFRKTMQRLCADGALSNSDTLRNKVMTEVHFWCRGKRHKLTLQQNNEMWELAKELQSGPKVGEIGMLSPGIHPTIRSK